MISIETDNAIGNLRYLKTCINNLAARTIVLSRFRKRHRIGIKRNRGIGCLTQIAIMVIIYYAITNDKHNRHYTKNCNEELPRSENRWK